MTKKKPKAEFNGIIVPSDSTIHRYGLSALDWSDMLEAQGFACGCCGKKPNSGRLFIDHEHVRGWKHMPPHERKLYVRGLACYVCNRFVLNYRVTPELLRKAANYLELYEARRPEV